MGYGYGRTTAHYGKEGRSLESGARVQTVFNNDMVAHVWNSQSQTFGRSNNGNYYFEGRALYSYGSHFLVGYIMPDGTALLNGDSYSTSTSGHQSDARRAVSNRPTLTVPALTKFYYLLESIERQAEAPAKDRRDSIRRAARELIQEHAEALATRFLMAAGESAYEFWNSETREYEFPEGRESAGAYLTRVAGLPAPSWPAMLKRAVRERERKEREAVKADKRRKEREAARLADITDSEFRHWISLRDSSYSAVAREALEDQAKALFRAIRTAKAAGFSKHRRDTLSARHKEVRRRLAQFDSTFRAAVARRSMATDIGRLRSARVFVERELPELSAWQIRSQAGEYARTLRRLAESPAFPFVTRRKLSVQADRAAEAIERLAAETEAREAAEAIERRRLAELEAAELRAAWLAGTAPLVRHFDAESGGAAIRIVEDRLETSHGATVPLRHAIRAFRFVKLCREAGRSWERNGERIRVGHFEIDRISADGDMKAGCHQFTWPEIERAARLAGVVDEAPSAEAIESRAA